MSESDENKISVEQIASAEALLGLEFTAEERQQMLEAINGRVAQYDLIRNTPLDNNVPMSLRFDVNVSDPNPPDVPRTYNISQQPKVTRPENLEDVAFYTVVQLAELIRTRQVTSVELTEMYLDRLKRYDGVLECVVTLTEDLALEQAKRADEEIANGNYRGPLHAFARNCLC